MIKSGLMRLPTLGNLGLAQQVGLTMSFSSNLSLIFKRVPESVPVPGDHLTVEDKGIDLGNTPQDGFITKNLYASLDPYMRLMLIPPGTKHYRAPFVLGEPIASLAIAEIVSSRHERYPTGMIVRARLPIQQYTRITAEWISKDTTLGVIPMNRSFGVAAYLGPLGMPGLTAYSSIFEIGKPMAGETIFISAASGAVGQLVGQICKKLGLRVIGSVGDASKLEVVKDKLGFDDGFIYKCEEPSEALKRLCPDGIDIYYDNVGGLQLEAAIDSMNKGGRIVISGMVSQYNRPALKRYGVRNLFQFVSQGLIMRGFQVGDQDFGPKWKHEHSRVIGEWLDKGELEIEMSEMVGMDRAAEAFVGMLEGGSRGKAVLRIWPGDGDTMSQHGFNNMKI